MPNCTKCGRGLIQQSAWHKAADEQRASWKANGRAPLASKEKCRNCYQRAYRRTLGCVRPELQEAS